MTDSWARLDELAGGAPSVEDALHHGLGVLAARHRRKHGRFVPPALLEEERFSAAAALATPPVLERVRAACPQALLVLKGPEIARRYPDPGLRPQHDLDLLAQDAAAVHRALVAAGCRVRRARDSDHHLPPLAFPQLPLMIEVHSAPKWLAGHRGPSAAELLAAAVPSPWGEDVLVLPPARHAVLVAVHAWAHRPLRRVLDLADVYALLGDGEREEAAAVARGWGVGRLWESTLRAADALLAGEPPPWPLRSWARNLPSVSERSPAERLLQRLLAPFAALPAKEAAPAAVRDLLRALRPASRESWRTRLPPSGPGHPSVEAARTHTPPPGP